MFFSRVLKLVKLSVFCVAYSMHASQVDPNLTEAAEVTISPEQEKIVYFYKEQCTDLFEPFVDVAFWHFLSENPAFNLKKSYEQDLLCLQQTGSVQDSVVLQHIQLWAKKFSAIYIDHPDLQDCSTECKIDFLKGFFKKIPFEVFLQLYETDSASLRAGQPLSSKLIESLKLTKLANDNIVHFSNVIAQGVPDVNFSKLPSLHPKLLAYKNQLAYLAALNNKLLDEDLFRVAVQAVKAKYKKDVSKWEALERQAIINFYDMIYSLMANGFKDPQHQKKLLDVVYLLTTNEVFAGSCFDPSTDQGTLLKTTIQYCVANVIEADIKMQKRKTFLGEQIKSRIALLQEYDNESLLLKMKSQESKFLAKFQGQLEAFDQRKICAFNLAFCAVEDQQRKRIMQESGSAFAAYEHSFGEKAFLSGLQKGYVDHCTKWQELFDLSGMRLVNQQQAVLVGKKIKDRKVLRIAEQTEQQLLMQRWSLWQKFADQSHNTRRAEQVEEIRRINRGLRPDNMSTQQYRLQQVLLDNQAVALQLKNEQQIQRSCLMALRKLAQEKEAARVAVQSDVRGSDQDVNQQNSLLNHRSVASRANNHVAVQAGGRLQVRRNNPYAFSGFGVAAIKDKPE